MWLWIFIVAFFTSPVAYAKSEYHSFVDEMVNDPRVFEEDPADEFLAEKREINQLFIQAYEQKKDKDFFYEILVKLNNLFSLEKDIYSESYGNSDLLFAMSKLFSLSVDQVLDATLPIAFSGINEESLKQSLKYENTWKDIDEIIINKLVKESSLTPEMRFKIDKRYFSLSKDILGEHEPMILKNIINLVRDYSVLGDSKTALEMEENLLPKVKKTFGEKSVEMVELLEMMATDYKILGNYGKSEKSLLKAIEINKALYGDVSSPHLLANLINLINLRRIILKTDDPLYIALEKAAKNISEDDLFKLGYFHTKVYNQHTTNNENNKTTQIIMYRYLDELQNMNSLQRIDTLYETSQNFFKFGLPYTEKLAWDLPTLSYFQIYLGNYHHKTLRTICSLSEDYLVLNKFDDALALSQDALKMSQRVYGDEHPCTIYALHSLTNVYRGMGKYSEALKVDQQAYELCKKVFVESSAGEPIEILTVKEDIAKDYAGMKNYSEAIKYYEELLTRYMSINLYESLYNIAEIRKNLAQLYNLTGAYEKTIALYDFTKNENGLYAFEKFLPTGLIACENAIVLGDALAKVGKTIDADYLYSHALTTYEELRSSNEHLSTEENQKWFANIVPNYRKVASFFLTQDEDMFMSSLMAIEFCKARGCW